jgi:hypothetical protein
MKKIRGRIALTSELLHQILELPENTEITDVVYDSIRGVVNVIVTSPEIVPKITYEVGEAQEIPCADFRFSERMKKNA